LAMFHRPVRSRESGFSFIEILIVMGIIAVLSGLVVIAIQIAAKKGPEFETKNKVQKLLATVTDIKTKTGGIWPPTDLTKLAGVLGGGVPEIKRVPNHTNEGIEVVYQAAYWPGVGLDMQLNEEKDLSNTDEDELEKPIGRGKTLDEVKDGWGNPIIYIPFTEYAAAFDKPYQYVTKDGETVDVRPWKTERGFENPNSCQVFSMGPDGVPNTEDDIKSW
jgi:prepilin-type N-terminal cleavage/methylation domain-containing protein